MCVCAEPEKILHKNPVNNISEDSFEISILGSASSNIFEMASKMPSSWYQGMVPRMNILEENVSRRRVKRGTSLTGRDKICRDRWSLFSFERASIIWLWSGLDDIFSGRRSSRSRCSSMIDHDVRLKKI